MTVTDDVTVIFIIENVNNLKRNVKNFFLVIFFKKYSCIF